MQVFLLLFLHFCSGDIVALVFLCGGIFVTRMWFLLLRWCFYLVVVFLYGWYFAALPLNIHHRIARTSTEKQTAPTLLIGWAPGFRA